MKVEKGQFPIPEEDAKRRKYALQMMWSGGLVLAIFIAATIYVAFTSDDTGGIYAMVALDAVTAAVLSWGAVWYFRRSNFTYSAGPVQVTFRGPDYYVPWEHMSRLVLVVMDAWKPLLDKDPVIVYSGVRLMITPERPIDPAGRTDEVIGLTYHSRRTSYVWGPYALHEGGAGYELALHGAEYLWPNSTEAVKIQRMKDEGVLDRIHQNYVDRMPT